VGSNAGEAVGRGHVHFSRDFGLGGSHARGMSGAAAA